jgi:hypothetical protein
VDASSATWCWRSREEFSWGALRGDGVAFPKGLPFDCVWALFGLWMQSRRLQQRLALVCWETSVLSSCGVSAALFSDCAACSSPGLHGVSGVRIVLANAPNV